jgi:hypothetical protein
MRENECEEPTMDADLKDVPGVGTDISYFCNEGSDIAIMASSCGEEMSWPDFLKYRTVCNGFSTTCYSDQPDAPLHGFVIVPMHEKEEFEWQSASELVTHVLAMREAGDTSFEAPEWGWSLPARLLHRFKNPVWPKPCIIDSVCVAGTNWIFLHDPENNVDAVLHPDKVKAFVDAKLREAQSDNTPTTTSVTDRQV